MKGLAILMMFQGFGWLLHHFLFVPLPTNVLGFILLSAALLSGVVKMQWVEQAGEFLLKHLMLFFVPVVVSTMNYLDLIRQEALPIMASLVISTFAVLLVTGWTIQIFSKEEQHSDEPMA